ncbi:Outer membrane protein assembly factor YaeT precursor [Arcticibacter svalbardensis MN12-7]|uniref:Outer membrane protein assembly factor BamA n=1 Tax=Arcticibacter svalbardensis MN12-7 TaxID=1150600 RepID=R9GWQ9_9SPHI|nr:outer membrane protein assembly factor BamA [Arcticibacter svalbardensis]EOR96242.1 Outer membrane protein assembly factor YaeT precursor [Arcticibacter svalbardensis MN12-7]
MNRFLIILLFTFAASVANAQIGRPQQGGGMQLRSQSGDELSYLSPKEYVIGGTTVSGIKFLDKDIIVQISKLTTGDRITVPGDATSNALKFLWTQGLFDDVQLSGNVKGDSIFFVITVVERPRLTRMEFTGLKKGQITDIKEKLADKTGKIVNESLMSMTSAVIKKYFNEKGYLFTEVTYNQKKDTAETNNVVLIVNVDKKVKTKVEKISFEGNKDFKDKQLKKFLKKTKEHSSINIFRSGKFLEDKYEEDKRTMIAKMQDKGYRDAEIISDSVIKKANQRVDIQIKLHEGPKYYFGKVTWAGNAIYTTAALNELLAIKKGDEFSEEKLQKRLNGNPNGEDISTLYLNNGYLTFNVDPVQTRVYGDTIDLELRIYEGPQYTVNKISLKGNDITNDKVVMREIRTKPGQKFSKEAVVRTTREIAQLGNFDEAKTDVRPIPNPADGTVDIEYTVAEKPSDQIELSGGFGGGRIIGTLGLTFNNFSARNLFNLKEWKPLPKGDGQKLSVRGQTNGKSYQSYSFSFSEPWLGGKKPVYFGISAFTSLSSNDDVAKYYSYTDDQKYRIRLNGVTFSLGKRLKWPDDYFNLNHSINLQQYKLTNYPGFLFSSGTAYNFNLTEELSRNSVDAPIYPTSGSHIRLTIQLTPPYSLFNNINYSTATDRDKYRFTEYHKWKFEAQWYQRIVGKLVVKTQGQFGFLGQYNSATGQSAFERFKLGGDGMQGFDYLQGSEVIAMRGYENNNVTPIGYDPNIARNSGSPIFSKYIVETRYPLMTGQQATVFVLAFAEGGNSWNKFADFNPFNVRRSAGVGARIFLPIFGLLGIDWGYGFDNVYDTSTNMLKKSGGQFHFSIAQQLSGGF